MISYGVLIAGIVTYYFTISSLIGVIRDDNFTQSFVRLIDDNEDGVVTGKQIKAFKPCQKYNGAKITKAFNQFAKRADVHDLAQELTPKIVLNSIQPCISNVEQLTQQKTIVKLNKDQITGKFLETFDIDNDKQIRYSQYNIATQFLQKTPKNLRQIFKYFDKNHDWKITEKQLLKSKPKNIHSFLVSGKRK